VRVENLTIEEVGIIPFLLGKGEPALEFLLLRIKEKRSLPISYLLVYVRKGRAEKQRRSGLICFV